MGEPNVTVAPSATPPVAAAETRVAPVVLLKVPGGIPNLNESIEKVVQAFPDLAIRVRIPLSIYDPSEQDYGVWRGTTFGIEFRDPALAGAFREDLETFIREWVERRARA